MEFLFFKIKISHLAEKMIYLKKCSRSIAQNVTFCISEGFTVLDDSYHTNKKSAFLSHM